MSCGGKYYVGRPSPDEIDMLVGATLQKSVDLVGVERDRLTHLQARQTLTEGERLECEMLLKRKWEKS